MIKNSTPLKRYLIYNRISGSYNLLNWLLVIVLTLILSIGGTKEVPGNFFMKLCIGVFLIIATISTGLLIFMSFKIQKIYDQSKVLVLYSFLSLLIPFIFNYLIRRKLKPFKD